MRMWRTLPAPFIRCGPVRPPLKMAGMARHQRYRSWSPAFVCGLPALLATVPESCIPDFEHVICYGLPAPASTLKEIIEKRNTGMVRLPRDAETLGALASQRAEAYSTSFGDFSRFLREDQERWKSVGKTTGIKID